jgi:hypothetical protein
LKKKWTWNKVRKKLRIWIYENIAMGDCESRIKTGEEVNFNLLQDLWSFKDAVRLVVEELSTFLSVV